MEITFCSGVDFVKDMFDFCNIFVCWVCCVIFAFQCMIMYYENDTWQVNDSIKGSFAMT